MNKPSYNATRRTGSLKKYALSKPENRKDINGRLGPADFFPLTQLPGMPPLLPVPDSHPPSLPPSLSHSHSHSHHNNHHHNSNNISNQPLHQEDRLRPRSITDGFLEPKFVADESSSIRKQMTAAMTAELKGQLLHSIYETEWRRSVLKPDPHPSSSSSSSSSTPSSSSSLSSSSTPSSSSNSSLNSSSSTTPTSSAPGTTGPTAPGTTKKGPPFPDQVGVSPALQKQWIARLAGLEPLSKLALQVPHTSKGDPLLKILLEANVPVLRATWYIKIIYLNMLRATKKSIDPPTEWTTTLTKFLASLMKEDHLHHLGSGPSGSGRGGAGLAGSANATGAAKHTKLAYVIKLIRWNYSEGLLDREMFLTHITDQLHESVRAEDGHTLAHLLYPYLPDVAMSMNLARRLQTTCSAKRAKLAPTVSSSVVARMLDSVLADVIKYLNLATEVPLVPSSDNPKTPRTPHTPHTPHQGTSLGGISGSGASGDTVEGEPFDAPKLAEALDDATLTNDIDELYATIFPNTLFEAPPPPSSLPHNNIAPLSNTTLPQSLLSTRHIARRILLLCEWAVTPYRKNAFSVHIVSSILTRFLKTHHPYLLDGSAKSPVQVFLIDFLETFVQNGGSTENSTNAMEIDSGNDSVSQTKKSQLSETTKNVARLFGELQRNNIFSHDSYVRYLISRGRLEGIESASANQPISHLLILQELPVGERGLDWKPRPRALHERNQRRTALIPHLPPNSPPSLQPTALALLESIISNSPTMSTLTEALVSGSIYEQYCISEWLSLAVMHAIEPSSAPQPPPPVLFSQCSQAPSINQTASTHSFSPNTLISSLQIILAVKNHYILARLLLWIITSTVHPEYIIVALGMIRSCDEAFITNEMLPELLDTLARVAHPKPQDQLPITTAVTSLLIEILTKYRDTSVCKKWTEDNPGLVPHARTTQLQVQSAAAVTQIRDVMSRSGPIPELMDNIINSQGSLDKAASLCIQSLSENTHTVRHASLLLSLMDPSPLKLGNALKSAISAYIQSSHVQLVSLGDFLVELVVSGTLPLNLLLQHVLLPMVQEFVTSIPQLSQTPQKINQVSIVVPLILFLFGLEHPVLKVEATSLINSCRTQLKVCVRDRKGQCLLLAFPLLVVLYDTFSRCDTKLKNIQYDQALLDSTLKATVTLLSDEDMSYLCLHHATTIYSHLKSFDSHTRRKIFSIMHTSDSTCQDGTNQLPPLTTDNSSTFGPSLVLAAVQRLQPEANSEREGEGWCVDRAWLELQLVLDEWALVDADAGFKGVKIVLSHFATSNNWNLYPVYSRLLRRMGGDFQVHLVRATLSILEQQSNALHQLPDSLNSLALSPYMLNYQQSDTKQAELLDDIDDDGISRGLGRLVARCLEASPVELCVETINQLCAQLLVFSDSSSYLDSLSLPISSLQAAQRSLYLRITLFVTAYTRLSNPSVGIDSSTAASVASVRASFPHTLLALAARPLVTCDNDALLLHMLHAIQLLTQPEPNDPNPTVIKKLADQYAKVRHSLPPAARNHIQKTLPFLAPTPAAGNINHLQHNNNNNAWTMLEDYPDAVLSPSQWGAVRVDRMEPAYAKVAFANAEPHPPKKLKLA